MSHEFNCDVISVISYPSRRLTSPVQNANSVLDPLFLLHACVQPLIGHLGAQMYESVTVAGMKFTGHFGSTLPSIGQRDEELERPAVACAACHSCAIK